MQLAAKDKERYEQEKLDNPVVVEESDPDAQDDVASSSNACIYQLGACACRLYLSRGCVVNDCRLLRYVWIIGRVKKIIQTDPDINRVSREALIAIAKASVRVVFPDSNPFLVSNP